METAQPSNTASPSNAPILSASFSSEELQKLRALIGKHSEQAQQKAQEQVEHGEDQGDTVDDLDELPPFLRPNLRSAEDLRIWKTAESSNKYRYAQITGFEKKWFMPDAIEPAMVTDWNRLMQLFRRELEKIMAAEVSKFGWRLWSDRAAPLKGTDPDLEKERNEREKTLEKMDREQPKTRPFRRRGGRGTPGLFRQAQPAIPITYQSPSYQYPIESYSPQPLFRYQVIRPTRRFAPYRRGASTRGRGKSEQQCYNCGLHGHFIAECPEITPQK